MDVDAAVRWMSEIRGGQLSRLRKDIRWFAEAESGNARSAVDRWIRDLVTLGYVDVDWRRDQWVMVEPLLTPIPGGHGYALLVGARGQRLATTLARAIDLDDPVLVEVPSSGVEQALPSPSAIFVTYRTSEELESAAVRLGVRLVSDVYRQLAQQLKRISLGERAGPPSRNGGLIERWQPGDREFHRFSDRAPWLPGLYKQEVNRVPRYLIFRKNEWFHTEYSVGLYLVSTPSDQLIRWIPESSCPSRQIGSLLVDNAFNLPDPQRRVAGLCSGFMPYVSRIRGGSTRYHNVPLEIARLLASSLGQSLEELRITYRSEVTN